MGQKQIEKNALLVSAIVNLLMAGAGVWVFIATNIYALLLDAFFSLIGCLSAAFAAHISKKSRRRSAAYPDGLYFLEPLYAVLKSLLTLALLILSVAATAKAAYVYFAHGTGEPLHIGPVLPYTVCMVILCFGLGLFNRGQNRRLSGISTMLTAEAKANMIDGVLSFGTGIAIVLLYFIDLDGPLSFLHYTGDFFITAILVLLSLKGPFVVLIDSFIELSHGTTRDQNITQCVSKTIDMYLGSIVQKKRCDIIKVGMHIQARVMIQQELDLDTIRALIAARRRIIEELEMTCDSLELEFIF